MVLNYYIILFFFVSFWIFLRLFLNFSSSLFEFFFVSFWIFLRFLFTDYYSLFFCYLFTYIANFIAKFNPKNFLINLLIELFYSLKIEINTYNYNIWIPIIDLWFLWITYKKWTFIPLYIVENYGNVSSIKYDLSIYPQHFLKTLYPRFFNSISSIKRFVSSLNLIESLVGRVNEFFKCLYFDLNYFKPFFMKLNFSKIKIFKTIIKYYLFFLKNLFLILFKKFIPYPILNFFFKFNPCVYPFVPNYTFLRNFKKFRYNRKRFRQIFFLFFFYFKYLILIFEEVLTKDVYSYRFFKKFDKKLRKFFIKFYPYHSKIKQYLIFFALMVKIYLWFFLYWLLEFLMPKIFFFFWSGFSRVKMNFFLKKILITIWFFFFNFF